MTEKEYKELLEGGLKLLNEFLADEDFLYLPPTHANTVFQTVDLKLRIADRLFQLNNRKETFDFKSIDPEAIAESIKDFTVQ